MSDPTYQARRAAEKAEADKRRAADEAAAASFDALTAFMAGRAALQVMPIAVAVGLPQRMDTAPRPRSGSRPRIGVSGHRRGAR